MYLRLAAVILAALLLQGTAAQAQVCTFSNTGIDFGNVSLTGGSFQLTTGTFTASCSGTAGRTVTICPNFNAGSGGVDATGDPRYMTQGAARLGYNLFKSNGIGQVWGSYTWAPSPRPPAMSVALATNGTGSSASTIYARIYNGQSTTGTGTYSSSFSGSQTQIDYGYSTSFSCSSTLSARAQNVPFVVRTTNNSSCTVATTALDFGSQPNLTVIRDATNTININCSPGTIYTVGLNGGTSGATNPTLRRMTNVATAGYVTYGIYRDAARTQPWGDTAGSNTASGTGTGIAQSFTGYGRVPVQTTPASLVYTDTVVVSVTY